MPFMGRIWRWQEEGTGKLFAEAKRLLAAHQIIALPTDTFYALAASPLEEEALSRLLAVKGRSPHKPVLVLVADPAMLNSLVQEIPETAQRLMEIFWPGPLTLILPARPQLPALLTGGTSAVGVRQPRQNLTCRLIAALGFPVTGTSANRAGQPALTEAAAVAQEFGETVPLIVDAGPCPGGLPSTIVDVTVSPPRLIRRGALEVNRLRAVVTDIAT